MGRKAKDLTGQVFGSWTVLGRAENKSGSVAWRVRCGCGTERVRTGVHLRSGRTQSCGCKNMHGMSHTPTYLSWIAMISRCTNPNYREYPRYGGRGITFCERWSDFRNFYADMGERLDGCTLGRIDGDGHYEPENCRWETNYQQHRNRSNNRYLTVNGKTRIMADWARETGIDAQTIWG